MSKDQIMKVNIADELRSGRHYGVFIDDTGSPGLNTKGLHSERKSWVAVLISPDQMPEVMDQLPKSLTVLSELGLKKPEFHFTDIWAGKGEFGSLNLQQRLGIFKFMTYIFDTYKFKILVQTFDPENSSDILRRAEWPKALGPLKFNRHEDLALIFALLRVRLHLKDFVGEQASACVVVDEGRFGSGYNLVIPGLAPIFAFDSILFASSRDAQPLQLADFAAFVMNRWQLLRVKNKLTDLDKTFLEIVEPLGSLFLNLDKRSVVGWPHVQNINEGLQ